MGGFIGSPEVNTLAFNADYRTCTTAAGKLHSLASFAVFASRFLKVFMKLLALWPIMYQYLQVVENILYSGSADMKVQAHDLNVSITSVSSRFRKSLKKFVSSESFFSFLFVFFFISNLDLRSFKSSEVRHLFLVELKYTYYLKTVLKSDLFNFNFFNFFPLLVEWRTCKILWRPHYECQRSADCGQCACDVMPRQTYSLLWSCGRWLNINSYMTQMLLHWKQVLFVKCLDRGLERVYIIVSLALSSCFPPKCFERESHCLIFTDYFCFTDSRTPSSVRWTHGHDFLSACEQWKSKYSRKLYSFLFLFLQTI